MMTNTKNVKTKKNPINITEVRIYEGEYTGSMIGYASITIDGVFVVTGIRIIDGQYGKFISFPSKQNKEGEYKDICYPIDKETRLFITDAILAELE